MKQIFALLLGFTTLLLLSAGPAFSMESVELDPPGVHEDMRERAKETAAQTKQGSDTRNATGASSLRSAPLPPYDTLVVAKKPKEFIGIYCTIAEPVDKETLERLGRDCFALATGTAYRQVLINWYLSGMPRQGKPWGVTNFAGDKAQVEIFGMPE